MKAEWRPDQVYMTEHHSKPMPRPPMRLAPPLLEPRDPLWKEFVIVILIILLAIALIGLPFLLSRLR